MDDESCQRVKNMEKRSVARTNLTARGYSDRIGNGKTAVSEISAVPRERSRGSKKLDDRFADLDHEHRNQVRPQSAAEQSADL